MKSFPRTILAIGAIPLLSVSLLCHQAQAQGPITGSITWGGSVELDTTSAGTANQVTAWHGTSTTPISGAPKVETVQGDLATFINVGDGTSFSAPWTFNSPPGMIINPFWSVDGFTFNLASSTVTARTSSAVGVTGTGTVSGHGFTPTAGTFSFSTQDPGAGNPQTFSFSAATVVPEGSTLALFGFGGACLAGARFLRRKD